jgi:hypothetical protein
MLEIISIHLKRPELFLVSCTQDLPIVTSQHKNDMHMRSMGMYLVPRKE